MLTMKNENMSSLELASRNHPTEVEKPMDAADSALTTALHVLSTEKEALASLELLYRTNTLAQEGMARAVTQIVRTIQSGGKLVVCGVGKSGKIGRKLAATMTSMGIYSVFLHPTEALHGDLGMIRPMDTLLLISFSGRTPELLLMLPHIPQTVPVIAITAHIHPSSCPLLSYHRSDMTVLLPAPVHIDEETSFGVSAPTTSTTVALALGDALALATARSLHTSPGRGPAEVFKGFHPGGAIGAASASTASTPKSTASTSTSTSTSSSMTWFSMTALDDSSPPPKYRDEKPLTQPLPSLELQAKSQVILNLAVPLAKIPTIIPPAGREVRVLDILLTAIQNPTSKSWVKLSSMEIITPHRIRSLAQESNVDRNISELTSPISVNLLETKNEGWIQSRASTPVEEVRQWVSEKANPSPATQLLPLIIRVIDDIDTDKCLGFVCGEDLIPSVCS